MSRQLVARAGVRSAVWIAVLLSFVRCGARERPAPQSGPVYDAAVRFARAAYASPGTADVYFQIDPASLDRDRGLTDAMTSIGYVSRTRTSLSFTPAARAVSSGCEIYSRPNCRRFLVASMAVDTAGTARYGQDDANRVSAVELTLRVRSTPRGKLGDALAKSGTAVCLSQTDSIPWRGASTRGAGVVSADFVTASDDDTDATLLRQLRTAKATVFVHCPVDPTDHANEISEIGATSPP